MSRQAATPRRPPRSRGGSATDYAARMEYLELQMRLLMEEHYGRVTDQVRFAELCERAKAIGGELTREFAFGDEGQISAMTLRPARATYRRPYWLTRKADDPATEIIFCDLPQQFAKLERALAHDEQDYQKTINSLAYDGEPPVMRLMERPDFEAGLQALARKAGGSLALKAWSGKIYAYYYRYKRLKTATVFSSLLTHSPYHTSGKHRYTFWLPVDYVLLRQLLESDAGVYATLPAEMKRPGYP